MLMRALWAGLFVVLVFSAHHVEKLVRHHHGNVALGGQHGDQQR